MCVYIYIYIYIYISVCVCVYAYLHARRVECVCTDMQTCRETDIETCCMLISCMYACMHAYIHTYIQTCTRPYMHACIKYTQTCVYIYIYIYYIYTCREREREKENYRQRDGERCANDSTTALSFAPKVVNESVRLIGSKAAGIPAEVGR